MWITTYPTNHIFLMPLLALRRAVFIIRIRKPNLIYFRSNHAEYMLDRIMFRLKLFNWLVYKMFRLRVPRPKSIVRLSRLLRLWKMFEQVVQLDEWFWIRIPWSISNKRAIWMTFHGRFFCCEKPPKASYPNPRMNIFKKNEANFCVTFFRAPTKYYSCALIM